MKFITTPKKSDRVDPFSVIVLGASYSYREKSYGNKLLLKINGETILQKQLKVFQTLPDTTEIIYVLGFEAEKIYESLCNKVKTIFNYDYENSGSLKNTLLGVRAATHNRILILHGDMLFTPDNISIPDISASWVGIQNVDTQEVGVGVDTGIVTGFNYGMPHKWSRLVYFNTEASIWLRRQKLNEKTQSAIDFELYNSMIDNNIILRVFETKTTEVEIGENRYTSRAK